MKTQSPIKLWNPYAGGAFLGFVLYLAFLLTGHGLGASGGVARVLAGAMDMVAIDHMRMSPYLSGYADAPFSHWIVPLIIGLFLGGMVSGALAGRSKVETLRGPGISPTTRLVFALIGGIIAGYGARLARGCTSGQALTGGAQLAVGSWAFMFAAFGGGYAVAWFARKLWN